MMNITRSVLSLAVAFSLVGSSVACSSPMDEDSGAKTSQAVSDDSKADADLWKIEDGHYRVDMKSNQTFGGQPMQTLSFELTVPSGVDVTTLLASGNFTDYVVPGTLHELGSTQPPGGSVGADSLKPRWIILAALYVGGIVVASAGLIYLGSLLSPPTCASNCGITGPGNVGKPITPADLACYNACRAARPVAAVAATATAE